MIKRVKNIDKIIVSHVDVSSCGMSPRRVYGSQSLTYFSGTNSRTMGMKLWFDPQISEH